MIEALELRRQLFHFIYGITLIFLHQTGILTNEILLGMIIGGTIASMMIKQKKLNQLRKVMVFFEREHHLEAFPGRGVLFFTIGSYLSLILFDPVIAYAGIAVLSVGDAVSNIVGRRYGKIKTDLNPYKNIEGNLVGILASVPLAYYFFPDLWGVLAASTVGMFLEIPNIRIFGFEIDDNLLIPLGASFTLTLFN